MADLEQHVQRWFGVGVDVAYSYVALVLVAFPSFALADDALGSPIGVLVVPIALGLALAGTASVVLQERSLERLGHFVVATFGSGVAWTLVVSTLVLLLDVPRQPRDPLPIFVAWTLSLATAGVLVYHGEDALGD